MGTSPQKRTLAAGPSAKTEDSPFGLEHIDIKLLNSTTISFTRQRQIQVQEKKEFQEILTNYSHLGD